MSAGARARAVAMGIAWALGYPILWPIAVARGALHGRRHAARMRAIEKGDAEAVIARVRRGEARSALRSTRGWATMASGPEEETCVVVELADGRRVLPASEPLERALREAAVPTRDDEGRTFGIGAVFAWGLWLVYVIGIAAAVARSVALAALAVVVVAALVGLGMS